MKRTRDPNVPIAEEEKLTDYPALAKCILIDARHSSRTDILRDLKASALFENIVEAKSIAHAQFLLETNQADACFLGPSLNASKVAEFIKSGKDKLASEDCAFIHVRSNNEPEHAENDGTHGVLFRPYTKRQFADQVVRAVVSANAGSPWAGILLQQEQANLGVVSVKDAPESPLGEVRLLDAKSLEQTLSAAQELREQIACAANDQAEQDIAVDIEQQTMVFVDQLIRVDDTTPGAARLKRLVQTVVLTWLAESKGLSRDEALLGLREKLLLLQQGKR